MRTSINGGIPQFGQTVEEHQGWNFSFSITATGTTSVSNLKMDINQEVFNAFFSSFTINLVYLFLLSSSS